MKIKKSILIADDELDMCHGLRDWFTNKGYSVDIAQTGKESLDKIRKGAYNLVISDIVMPDMSGMKILQNAKEMCPDIYVILITGYASTQTAIESLRYGAYDYISKPFKMDRIGLIVERAIREQALELKNRKLLENLKKKTKELSLCKMQLERKVRDTNHRLDTTMEQLVQAERLAAIGEIAEGVAHELGNPLTIISGTIQFLLSSTSVNNAAKKHMRPLSEELERCNYILKRLSDFTHSSSLKLVDTDIDRLLEDTLQFMNYDLKRYKIKVTKKLSPELSTVTADPNQMKEVFLNLILNAKNAMPKGGELTVCTRNINSGKGIAVEFTDTGAGIPKKDLSQIFIPFFTTQRDKGKGLGLAITHKIVQDHGGTIGVKSKVGKGTTFTIKLLAKPAGK